MLLSVSGLFLHVADGVPFCGCATVRLRTNQVYTHLSNLKWLILEEDAS